MRKFKFGLGIDPYARLLSSAKVDKPSASTPANYVPTSDGQGGYAWQAGGGGTQNAVLYTAQTLTTAQKIQALKNLDGVRIVKLTDGTETLSSLVSRITEINTAEEHVFFDVATLNYPLYLCTLAITYSGSTPSTYRLNDLVTGKTSMGTYSASKTLSTILSEAVDAFYTLTVTCVTQDGVTVTGQTVTLRQGGSTGGVYATASYNGQPVSFVVPNGFSYYVSVSDTLASHFNPTTASGIITANTSVTLTYSDFSSIRTASDIKAALNADIDLTRLVGEQITCTKGSSTLTWDVADYDSTLKEVTLLLHDTLPDTMVFEPPQALAYYENGLAAGNYYFVSGGTNYYFALATAIPNGGQLKATTSAFTTYASQSTVTALESGSVSTTAIEGATSIGTAATGTLNQMDRVSYGSNNYAECGLRQWLNSMADANTQMPRINKFSRPYSVNLVGFLKDLDADFISCLENTEWKCNTNNVYEAPASLGFGVGRSTAYTVTDKIGIASQKEIFGSYDGTDAGDAVFDLYANATATDRIKYYNTSARSWWLRSPRPDIARNERHVHTSGGVNGGDAYVSGGAVPACKIRKSS